MPLYNYECLDCFDKFEKYIPYTEDVPRMSICPKCGSNRAYRLLAREVPAVIYATDGFYTSDNKKKGNGEN